ncbi:hypothetical protein [Modestobacter altitudinis]|uniref:hypothetical protein n=1 Tax=Modestobacter altitudinis TaxID=2213158 RepID=UPI00110D053C|nr:hypothetical protein [Modestobacter altitudinis]
MTLTDPASPVGSTGPVVLTGTSGGLTFVPDTTPLVGLNYYDGRYLRADDLNLERRSQRRYVEFANQAAAGPGPVWGFELAGLGTPCLTVAAGLAVAPAGPVLHLPVGVEADVATLTARSSATPPSPGPTTSGFTECLPDAAEPAAAVVPGTGLYLVCLAAGSGLCGHAEVFGRPCDDGCVTATDRPYVVDGVTLLLRPLSLDLRPFSQPGVTRPELHLRSQVASAWFAEERRAAGSRLSATGLGAGLWGAGAGSLAGEDVVPLGVLGWDGSRITLLDMWTARRERMEPSPRSHWAGRVEQRPWPVFLAQVLQFQSQLAAAPPAAATIPARVLVERGFVAAPAAFYLGIDPAGDVRAQAQDLLGPGVELRLCAVRRDQVPHELERAQHMDRISLLRGIADPAAREQVDVLVPDGVLQSTAGQRTGIGFAVDLDIGVPRPGPQPRRRAGADPFQLHLSGTGRVAFGRAIDVRAAVAAAAANELGTFVRLLGGLFAEGTSVTAAGDELGEMSFGLSRSPREQIADTARAVFGATSRARAAGNRAVVSVGGRSGARVVALLTSLTVDDDPFSLQPQQETAVEFCVEAALPRSDTAHFAVRLPGRVRRLAPTTAPTQDGEVALELTGVPFLDGVPADRSVVVRLLARRSEEDDGRQVLRVRTADRSLAVEVGWQGAPVGAHGEVTVLAGAPPEEAAPGEGAEDEPAGTPAEPARRSVATLEALEDPRIGYRGDPYHDMAVDALTILSSAHPEPDFVETQARLLFPDDDATVATTTVRAATDWVLVRRRRRECCEGAAVPPVEVAAVTAWVLRTGSGEDARTVASDVVGGDWPAEGWERAELAFAPGSATLLTLADTWRTRYGQLNGGSRVALAGYTGMPGSQAATTGIGRLTAVLDALTPAAELDSDGVRDFVSDPPQALLVPGTDGSIFLVTYDPDPEPEPDDLRVIAAYSQLDGGALSSAIIEGDVAPVQTAEAQPPETSALDELGQGSDPATDLSAVPFEARRSLVDHRVAAHRELHSVLWTHEDLTADVRAALGTLAGRVRDSLRAEPELVDLVDLPAQEVDFDRGPDGAAARLYVIVTNEPDVG